MRGVAVVVGGGVLQCAEVEVLSLIHEAGEFGGVVVRGATILCAATGCVKGVAFALALAALC